MKLSIITTITNPEKRQDPWIEAINNYLDLADEVIVVNGGEAFEYETFSNNPKLKQILLPWPEDWNFQELPRHLNAGLKEATGDWVLKLDIDQFIHENDFQTVRKAFESCYAPVMTFQKYTVLPGKSLLQKGEIICAINKRHYPEICFGDDPESDTDLCMPLYPTAIRQVNAPELDYAMPIGPLVKYEEAGRSGITIWNFDYTFKTAEFTRREFYKFSKAWQNYFGKTSWGHSEEESFKVFINNMSGRCQKAPYQITNLDVLPKYIREKYQNLKKEEFGFNGWGLI